MTLFQYLDFFSDPLTSRQTRAPIRTCLMPIASVVLTIPKTAIGSEKRTGESVRSRGDGCGGFND